VQEVVSVPRVGTVELKISRVEGFRVTIRHPGGADVRADRQGLPQWPYERAARDAWTVANWRRDRFVATYPGFTVDVHDGDVVTAGNTLLENVRDTYD
jgi:hypothetical protein